jgi:hypothetical protein
MRLLVASPFTNEVPPLLVNRVFPPYMRCGICFQCQRAGHFKSFCPYYRCENCKRPLPQHYPKNCPFHHVDSLLTIVKMTMKKKKKMTSPINFVMMNLMMISAEMEHGEISWENLLTIKSNKDLIYSFHPKPPLNQASETECTSSTLPPVLLPTPLPFLYLYSQLLCFSPGSPSSYGYA